MNKYPDRARQRAAAELAAALPKNPALRGPALAAFLSHPEGKRAAAAMDIEAPVLYLCAANGYPMPVLCIDGLCGLHSVCVTSI